VLLVEVQVPDIVTDQGEIITSADMAYKVGVRPGFKSNSEAWCGSAVSRSQKQQQQNVVSPPL
jgi:hypothetical protein